MTRAKIHTSATNFRNPKQNKGGNARGFVFTNPVTKERSLAKSSIWNRRRPKLTFHGPIGAAYQVIFTYTSSGYFTVNTENKRLTTMVEHMHLRKPGVEHA